MFSGDGKYLAAQGGSPDWTLALWGWEKGKLLATARTAAQPGQTAVQCLFQPGGGGARTACRQTGRQEVLIEAARACAGSSAFFGHHMAPGGH